MLFLDDIERNYLKELLLKHPSTWWPHKKIQEKIEVEEKRLEEIKNCSHEFGTYKGEKECCTKCDAFGEGMGFEWILEKTNR